MRILVLYYDGRLVLLVQSSGQASPSQTFERHFHLDRFPTACIFLSRGMLRLESKVLAGLCQI